MICQILSTHVWDTTSNLMFIESVTSKPKVGFNYIGTQPQCGDLPSCIIITEYKNVGYYHTASVFLEVHR